MFKMPTDLVILVMSTVFSVLGWFLRSKDEQQSKSIELLFIKHDEDEKRLQDLRIQIAENYFDRAELDKRFDKIEVIFKNSTSELTMKVDRLIDLMVQRRDGK